MTFHDNHNNKYDNYDNCNIDDDVYDIYIDDNEIVS